MRDVDALHFHLAFAAYGHRVNHRADRCHAIGFGASLFESDTLRRALWQRLSPTQHLRRKVKRADHVVLVREACSCDELSPITIRVFTCRVGELVHEALAIELVRGLTDPASR